MKVLVVGAGGLGAPALIGLAARGVRRMTVMDADRVELSNLHRQILYRETDVGSPKAVVAARRIGERFGAAVEVEGVPSSFDTETQHLIRDFDVVLDATDGFETKLALSDACVDYGVRYVFGAVVGYDGQAMAYAPGHACVRCLFDEAPPPGAAPTCAELGILGPVAGIVAARQVDLALSPAHDRIWIYDGRRDQARDVLLRRTADCRGCGPNTHRRGIVAPNVELEVEPPARELDLDGLVCPHTYIQTSRALAELPLGGRLWVRLSSDEAARNVPKSAIAAGHRVLVRRSDGRVHRVLIERGAPRRSCFDGDYDSDTDPAPEVHGR